MHREIGNITINYKLHNGLFSKFELYQTEGDIGIYGMAVLAYFCYGIFLEKLRCYDIGNLAVHSICNFGLKSCGN
jgi:hypothetical protein